MTSYGFNDAGGGTIVPRLVSKELARRGWEVTVFHPAVQDTDGPPYALHSWEEDGVRLVAVHNRPHRMLDLGNPWRELDDPPITRAFAELLDDACPDVVHFHNLHNLGAALLDEAAARGLPAYFSTHNYWPICPRAYLLTGDGAMCAGPGDRGGDCAACVGSHDRVGHQERLAGIRGRFARSITACLAVSDGVRRTLIAQGYPADQIDVVRQAMPAAEHVWETLGRDRRPGRVGGSLTVAFFGSAYWHKGPQLLVEAAQQADCDLRVKIHGEVPAAFARKLESLDRRGLVELSGHFAHEELPTLLADVDAAAMPSLWWDCAPLMAAECLAGRVPLLAPRLGGLPEAVRHEQDGLLFDALSAEDLARQLERLATEPGLLERLQAGIEAPRPFAEYVDELEDYYAGRRPSRSGDVPAAVPDAEDAMGEAHPSAGVPTVRWVGDHTLPTSLSIVNQRVCERLPLPLQRVARDGRSLDAPLPHGAEVEVRHQWPPDLRPATSGRLAVIQPWEFGALPRDWVDQIRANVDELWVPSEFVRAMYVESGVEPERVQVVPNGVDLDRFRPAGEQLPLEDAPGLRFLFVGGLIQRKGPDLLLAAWRAAFAGRDDVTLVVKDFGAGGVYARADRSELRAYAESGELPRLVLLDDELAGDEMAALYRACDVLVHPYRGEGFGMPVLEAMACGLPTIVTAGGPTDEFCPDDACWRIPSTRRSFPEPRVGELETVGLPWQLEPDADALVELLRAAAADPAARNARGAAGAEAARGFAWDAVAALYARRIEALGAQAGHARPHLIGPPVAELSFEESVDLRVLAAPAWRAEDDRLAELLDAWRAAAPAGTSACLYLLVGSAADGEPQELLERTAAAAARAGVALDAAADVTLLVPPFAADHDRELHAAVDAYVDLPGAAPGHLRAANAAGNPVLEPAARSLSGWIERVTACAGAPSARAS
jgi:glycosyltransferase involved in cell wall biosynthesis